MGAVGFWARARLRSEWKAAVGLALLVAIAGAAVLASLAAAHRTNTAYDRMVDATKAADVFVNPETDALRFADVARLPQVTDSGLMQYGSFVPARARSVADLEEQGALVLGSPDPAVGYRFHRFHVLEGQVPDARSPFEVLVNAALAKRDHLRVGDAYRVRVPRTVAEANILDAEPDQAWVTVRHATWGAPVTFRVVGIGVTADDVVVDEGFDFPAVRLTPAFPARYPHALPPSSAGGVRLRDGARDVPAFRRAVQALVPGQSVAFQTQSATRLKVQRAVRPYVGALLIFASVAVLLGLLVIGQAFARRLHLERVDQSIVADLGMTRGQRWTASMLWLAVPILAGTACAVALAWALSPIGPLGPARTAEMHPGLSFDVPVIGAATGAIVALLVLVAAIPAWRCTRVRAADAAPRPSRLARLLVAGGASVPVVTGVRFGLEPGRGRNAVPTRTVLVGAVTAVVLAAGMLTFGSSLGAFLATPREYGTGWDAEIATFGTSSEQQHDILERVLARSTLVDGFALVHPGAVTLSGRSIPAVALGRSAKPLAPTMVAGRAPRAADEVALGSKTMAVLRSAVGRRIVAQDAEGRRHSVTVVGTVVLPAAAPWPGADKTALGEGALLTAPGLGRLSPVQGITPYAVRLSSGHDLADLSSALRRVDPTSSLPVRAAARPADVVNLDRLRATPTILLGLLVALVAAAVAHALATAVRHRRRDLAVLQATGLRPRQVVATTLWQATVTAVIALAVGLPLGVVVGRWSWSALAESIGAVADPVVPALALAGAALVVLLLANLVGVVPGWRAARRSPAAALRTE